MKSGRLMEGGRLIGGRLIEVGLYSSQKQNIVIPEVTSEANSSHSPLLISREHGKGQIYQL